LDPGDSVAAPGAWREAMAVCVTIRDNQNRGAASHAEPSRWPIEPGSLPDVAVTLAATLASATDAPPVPRCARSPIPISARRLPTLPLSGEPAGSAGAGLDARPAEYTRAVLEKLPGRGALLERIHALSNADPQRGASSAGQRYFYELVEPGAQQPKLMYRDGLNGEERLLVDPAKLATDPATHYALDYYTPSWMAVWWLTGSPPVARKPAPCT